jgi:hypothetical protein
MAQTGAGAGRIAEVPEGVPGLGLESGQLPAGLSQGKNQRPVGAISRGHPKRDAAIRADQCGCQRNAPATNAVAAAPDTDGNATGRLRAQAQNLQADNETLQAKLKEALSAQPATVDTQKLAAAQAQVLSLMKENDLLRASLATGATNEAAREGC